MSEERPANRVGLSKQAYEPLSVGEEYQPYIPASEHPLEFTIKSVIPGILFGILFGAANAYLGLRAGLTISTSIPVAVMTVASFRMLRRIGVRGTLLEANMSQTVGSASSSVASGVIFTLPALFMWQMAPGLLQMTLLAMCGGWIGVLFMIPLRRFLIAREHGRLPYPEGTACAEVLVASEVGGSQARNVFWGLGAGALVRFVFGWLKALPDIVRFPVPVLPKAQLGLEASPALFGVGYILGPKIAAVMVSGGLLSSLVLVPIIAIWGAGRTEPFYPETNLLIADMSPGQIWKMYVRYIGAGAVATAGFITLIKSIPVMVQSFRIGLGQIRSRIQGQLPATPRTDQELSLKTVGVFLFVIAVALAAIPQIFAPVESLMIRSVAAVCVVVFAFFFVTVSARIVGLVGVTSNPTSGMTIASLLGTSSVFLLMGWTDDTGKAAALTVGCVVAIAASIAGDTSQDLKTGFLLGATPRRQQIGELIGVLTSATAVCWTVIQLDRTYVLGSESLKAPQATLMKLVIDGVLQAQLPWMLIGIGAIIAAIAHFIKVPALPFSVGVYLSVTTMVPVFLGGLLRLILERTSRNENERESKRERGILFGSGLVGGEGLMGVLICAGVGWSMRKGEAGGEATLPGEIGTAWATDVWGSVLALVLFGILIGYFTHRCRRI